MVLVNFDANGSAGAATLATAGPSRPASIATASGVVIFSGGVLLDNLANPQPGEAVIYATGSTDAGGDPGLANTITITLPVAVSAVSLDVVGLDQANATYTISDNFGDSTTLAEVPGSNVSQQFVSLGSASGPATITTITITTAGGGTHWDFGVDNLYFGAPLFSNSNDVVNFNALTSAQQAAVAAGADIYHALGGSDVVTLPDLAHENISVGANATLGWDETQTFYTNSRVGDHTTVNLADGNYNLALGAGSDTITVAGNGATSIACGSGAATIDVAAGSNPQLTISGFAPGDVIDVPVQANEALYDPIAGTLSLYNAAYGAALGNPVEVIYLTDPTGTASYAVAPDGSGGTRITIGNPPPSVLQLAQLSQAAYGTVAPPAPFTALASIGANGFSVVAYGETAQGAASPDQIVIAISATSTALDQALVKSFINTGSFDGLPGFNIYAEVAQVSAFLEKIRTTYPDASITLTGHSFGGGIADIVGTASGYPTATFDAPGTTEIYPALTPLLTAANQANGLLGSNALPYNSPLPALDTDYRLAGDQVSLTDTALGTVETISNPGDQSYLGLLGNHDIGALVTALGTQSIIDGAPDALLSGVICLPPAECSTGSSTIISPRSRLRQQRRNISIRRAEPRFSCSARFHHLRSRR